MAKEFSVEWSPKMEQLIHAMELKPKMLPKDIYTVTKNTLVDAHNTAFARARVRTGFMRDSFYISLDKDLLGGRLWGGADYTVYNEYGTVNMPARPAIRFAFMIYRKRWLDDLLKIVELDL